MALARSASSRSESGFSLVEVMVATTLLAVGLVSLAQLFAVAAANNTNAHNSTFAAVLAEQKMEQLRALAWGFDPVGLPISDSTTNTAAQPETSTGGTGLSPSPDTSLVENTPGYVDYVDRFGNILGGGSTAPSGTVYVRRWSVEPLPTNPNNTLILQVLVTPHVNRSVADAASVARLRDEARLMSVKTRKAT
jgi:prepilin-type N-terminal cleavage/methylation domain-containing protein